MKKLMILVTAVALCLCAAGCLKGTTQKDNHESSASDVGIPQSSELGTTEGTSPVESLPEMADDSTQDTIEMPERGELSQPPSADYTLPPDERPGDRVTDAPTS